MDTFENEALEQSEPKAEAQQEAAEQPAAEPQVEGSYHAEGVGQKEAVSSAYSFHGYAGQGVYQQPQEPVAAEPAPVKKKKEHKTMKRVGAWVLAVVLILGSGTLSAVITNNIWRSYVQGLTLNFEEKVDILQGQLNNQGSNVSGGVVTPSEGLPVSQLYEKTVDSVVTISCKAVVNSYGQSYTSTSSGSGFVLTADGYIVTNHHVIEEATSITVVTSQEKSYTATLVGSDSFNDIALLKVEAQGLQPAAIGSSDALSVGSQVVAIGNALGEFSSSLTVGYISGKDRSVTTDGTVINMLQTDAVINPGNSGGPLFNMKGEVVGITTAKYSGSTSSGASIEGIGFAIPIDDVIGMLEDLRDYGYITGVQLGVMVRNMDSSVVETYGLPMGAYVESVVAGGCAQIAGVRGMDIITEVGGYKIENINDLTRALRKFEAGQTATIKVWRSGREELLTIVFDAKPQS